MAPGDLFEAVCERQDVPRDDRVPLLIWWAARFSELGFTPTYGPGDHGNLSCRTPRGCVITARATTKASLQPEHLVEVVGMHQGEGLPQIRYRGLRVPSTDTLLHLRVYAIRPDVQAILHGHDVQTLARAAVLKLPVTRRSAVAPSPELIDEVCQMVRTHEYLLLRDHGFLAMGRSLDEAGERVRQWCARARSG